MSWISAVTVLRLRALRLMDDDVVAALTDLGVGFSLFQMRLCLHWERVPLEKLYMSRILSGGCKVLNLISEIITCD